jgi:hypothetical protein
MIFGVLALIVSKQEAQMCQKWFLACCSSIKLPVLFIFWSFRFARRVVHVVVDYVDGNNQLTSVYCFLTVP